MPSTREGLGVIALVGGDSTALAVLMAATVALWLMATIRHAMLIRHVNQAAHVIS